MRITYDREADAAYISVVESVGPGESKTQQHSIATPTGTGEIVLDYDAAGFLLGVEILGASGVIRPELLEYAPPPSYP